MKRIGFIFFMTFVLVCTLKGQKENYFGASFSVGYKSIHNLSGIAAQARLLNHIDLDLGWTYSHFNGHGYSGGINYVPLNTKVQPFIGFQYGKSFGNNNFDITEGENISYYNISPIEFVYVKFGVMYELEEDEDQAVKNMPAFFSLSLSYRYAVSNYQVVHTGGNPYKYEESLNKRMGDGLGFSVSLIVLFGKVKD